MQQNDMEDEEESQNNATYIRSSFDPSDLRMKIKTLTHDYYVLELPENKTNQFYKHFPFYLQERDFRGNRINFSPVARIYGTNEFGQKCCCHIHGYFPHFYIKANEYSDAFTNDRQFVKKFLTLLQGLYQRAYTTNKPIIINAIAEQKMDFYGYHEHAECFLKITVYDPAYVVKLRELLDSQILNGRSFQCYEAHLNYFMQLFSDHNIYGINQLSVIEFSFRKNLNYDLMELFKKINTQTKKLFNEGYDVGQIQKSHPNLFNCLEKISSCYIQLDLYINSILNTFAPQHQIADSNEEESIDSQVQVQNRNEGHCKRKFQVKITRALQQIWEDQKRRREIYGIQTKTEGILDMSHNIQGKNAQLKESKDPMWINFLNKGNNAEILTEMIRSFSRGEVKNQTKQLQIERYVAENYSQVLHKQRQKLIQKVKARWKFYGVRKANYLQQILKGERQELPQWDDDKNYEDDQSSSEGSEKQQMKDPQKENSISKSDSKSQSSKLKKTNTELYRNNYKHQRSQLDKQSHFYVCGSCKEPKNKCKCVKNQFEVQSTNDDTLAQDQSQSYSVRSKQSTCERYLYHTSPPTVDEVMSTCVAQIQKPFYSDFEDLFDYHRIDQSFAPSLINAQILDRQLKTIKEYNRDPISIKNQQKLPNYFRLDPSCEIEESEDQQNEKQPVERKLKIKFQLPPPTQQQILQQRKKKQFQAKGKRRSTSIKMSKQDTFVSDLVVFHYQFITGFQDNSERYCADPEKDEIICFSFQVRNFQQYRRSFKGLILIEKFVTKGSLQVWQYEDIYFVKNQFDLLSMVISIIFRLDPDMLVTYDQQKKGIRYLTQRGFAHGINFQSLISRSCDLDELFEFINFKNFTVVKQAFLTKEILLKGNILWHKQKHKISPQLGFLQQKLKQSLKRKPVLRQKYRFDIEVKGRVNMSLYRICEAQLKLKSYTIENVCRHLFNEQISQFTDKDLFKIYCASVNDQEQDDNAEKSNSNSNSKKITKQQGVNFALQYITKRLQLQAQIVTGLNMITVLVQKSKIYGSDIVSMMERGSQFKIEAIMCRVTKKLGYLTLSASKRQVGNQSILECVPLVLEPPKQFFSQPVLLFDFQSLYPSVMIAYNICYSTCIGSISLLFDKNKDKKIGVSEKMNIDISFLEQMLKKCSQQQIKQKLCKSIFVSPNKVGFVKKQVKEGIIPRILLQFLLSRIMIKKSQGLYKKTKVKKILKDRQYALKLFMNVMFGYAGASFSGRMPCSQIADSIVQISKYLLRQSIQYLNTHSKYKGKVIYGDTDSIFFHMPGYTINQSIKIGRQLAMELTGLFPYPIQMKFEKVYDGLFLVAKKRYYGKMYESETSGPKYQGKGLQCVRRDGINLTSELMKQLLNTLIDTRDLTVLKKMFKEECNQILNNQKSQSLFWLAKQVKLLKYNDKYCPAHGEAAKRLQKIDPMLVPKYGERMKYFVINGGLKPIRSRSIPVFEYLNNPTMSLDLEYYLRKQVVPPLQRVFSSLADLNEWTCLMEYRSKFQFTQDHQIQPSKKCLHCNFQTMFVLCQQCIVYGDEEMKKAKQARKQSFAVCKECLGCQKIAKANKCVEYNCEQLWDRRTIQTTEESACEQIIRLQQAIKQLQL